MTTSARFALMLSLFTLRAEAFLPPVTSMVREALEGRKAPVFEVSLHHKVTVGTGAPVIIDEKILSERGRPSFVFKISGLARSVGGSFDGKTYTIAGHSFPSRSAVLVRALTATSPDALLAALLDEGFVREAQLHQFKAGFSPEGDPHTWDTRDSYLRHPDIFLERLHAQPGTLGTIVIAVVGTDSTAVRKTADFDRKLHGLRRLEWREGPDQAAWHFEAISSSALMGYYPHHLTFEKGGAEVVTTELLHASPLRGKAVSELQAASHSGGEITSEAEAALRLLLSYR